MEEEFLDAVNIDCVVQARGSFQKLNLTVVSECFEGMSVNDRDIQLKKAFTERLLQKRCTNVGCFQFSAYTPLEWGRAYIGRGGAKLPS